MRRLLACLSLALALTACSPVKHTPSATSPDFLTVAPYSTVTPSQTPTVLPAQTAVILPTPTVFTYTVVAGDTLNSIAQRYGVTVEALKAANSGVQLSPLIVGVHLTIPSASGLPGEATTTPAALPLLQARCRPEASGGLWCFALFQNEYTEPVENLAAQFTLLNANNQVLASQIVYGLLDILPAGETMPLAAYFPPPVDPAVVPRVQLLTAIRLLPGDARYLSVVLDNTLVSVDSTGRVAQVSGRATLTSSGTANTLWVLATDYDASGEVVGVRRWEATSALTAEAPLEFEFQVASLGPAIARVDFLAEARP